MVQITNLLLISCASVAIAAPSIVVKRDTKKFTPAVVYAVVKPEITLGNVQQIAQTLLNSCLGPTQAISDTFNGGVSVSGGVSGSVGGSVGGGGNGSTPGSNGGPITISNSAGSTSDVLNSVLSNLKIITDAMVAAHASTQQYSYNNLGASIGGGISGGGSITVVGDGRGGRMNGGGNGVNGAGPGNGGQPLNNVGVTATSAPNPDDHYSVCKGIADILAETRTICDNTVATIIRVSREFSFLGIPVEIGASTCQFFISTFLNVAIGVLSALAGPGISISSEFGISKTASFGVSYH